MKIWERKWLPVTSFEYTITDEVGIHARPAGMLVKLVREFQSEVILASGSKNADAKKLMAVMALGIRKGQTVTVSVDGPDEQEAAEKIRGFFRDNL